MTYDDDMMCFNFSHGVVRQSCKQLGVEWPPPEKVELFGFVFERLRMSGITDEQRADMTHVLRAAEYEQSRQLP